MKRLLKVSFRSVCDSDFGAILTALSGGELRWFLTYGRIKKPHFQQNSSGSINARNSIFGFDLSITLVLGQSSFNRPRMCFPRCQAEITMLKFVARIVISRNETRSASEEGKITANENYSNVYF